MTAEPGSLMDPKECSVDPAHADKPPVLSLLTRPEAPRVALHGAPPPPRQSEPNLNLWAHSQHFWIDPDCIQVMRWHLHPRGLGVERGVVLDWVFH